MEDLENQWVAGLRRGDTATFDAVYDAYRARLFGFLWRMTQDRELATDLFQETWLRVVNSASRLADDTRLTAWIFTIARNVCRSHYRWSTAESSRLETLQSTRAKAAFDTPYEVVAADETQARIEAAFAVLPLPYREALVLFVSNDLSSTECAQLLGITEQTFRKRLSRARQRIAGILE